MLTFSTLHICLPLGSQLELSEENVQGVLAACREEIGYVQYSRLSACSFALVLNSFLPLPFNEILAKMEQFKDNVWIPS